MGVSAGIWLNLLTALVQLAAAPEMRGRVMGVSTMAYQLIGLGWLIGGTLASLLGLEATVLAGGITFAGASIAVFAMSEEMRKIN
jgi:predicted MFS family arabinose efflux permease